MEPVRNPERTVPGARAAAVLVPLFEEDGETRVVLTRRSALLPSHQGEVAFPGGRVDEGEALADAALREAHEEVDLDPSTVELIGELDWLTTVSSAFLLTPFVGALAGRPALRPHADEVEAVFDVALAEVLADGVFQEERWDVGEGEWPVYFFDVEHDTIWGATARVLYQLLDAVTRLG